MSWLGNAVLGSRPEWAQMPGMQQYIDAIQGPGGASKEEKYARQDVKAGREGRIEDMGRLKPVLAAINARSAGDKATGERDIGRSLAFSSDPALAAAMGTELTGKINENAGQAFAGAAAGAYGDAEHVALTERARRQQMEYQAATDRARLYQGSMYDNRRSPGALNKFMDAAFTSAGKAVGGGISAIPGFPG